MPPDYDAVTSFDETVAPRRRRSASTEILDGEAVVYSEETAALHVLNPSATVIWQSLDGEVSLGDLATELSEAFDVAYEIVLADVLKLVGEFGIMGLLEEEGSIVPGRPESPPHASEGNGTFLPVPSFGCDTSVVQQLEWASTSAYQFGTGRVGLRANDRRTDELLRSLLAAHLVEDLRPPHANHSLRLATSPTTAALRSLHLVYDGDCLVWRSRDPASAIEVVLRQLGAYNHGADVDGPRVWCAAFRCPDGSAIIMSTVARRQATRQAARLRSRGLELLPTPYVRLDVASGEAVLEVPTLTVEWEILTQQPWVGGDVLRVLQRETRLPLRAWVFLSGTGTFEPMRRADALPLAVRALVDRSLPTKTTMRSLARAIEGADPVAAGDLGSPEAIARLPELVR
jgi:hypothetical protein